MVKGENDKSFQNISNQEKKESNNMGACNAEKVDVIKEKINQTTSVQIPKHNPKRAISD